MRKSDSRYPAVSVLRAERREESADVVRAHLLAPFGFLAWALAMAVSDSFEGRPRLGGMYLRCISQPVERVASEVVEPGLYQAPARPKSAMFLDDSW